MPQSKPLRLPDPHRIANGDTINLECGRVYSGTLDLRGKHGVRVRTAGGCGHAAISPGSAPSGWARHKGGIWVASLDTEPVQVALDGVPMARARHPNAPQTWAKGSSRNPSSIEHVLPHADLKDALVVYRPYDWMIETRRIRDYQRGNILLADKIGDAFDPPPQVDFYVEGKLWMLDAPGEWAYSDGRLYLWPVDGKPPEGRVWAAPPQRGIDARDTRAVSIEGVQIFSSLIGIDGGNSQDLHISNSEIRNSAENGIFAGGSGLVVERVLIENSVQNGILGDYGIRNSVVSDSVIMHTGTFGNPRRSKGALAFEDASGQRITGNRILQSSYIAIRVHRNAQVSGNLIDGACLVLSDCGGIYTFARDRQPLHVRIEGNTVMNLAQRYAHAIYLDDFANGVVVSRNLLRNNPGGLQIHNGFNNDVIGNTFSASAHEHILFNDTGSGGNIRNNTVMGNTFQSHAGVPVFRLWSTQGGNGAQGFARFDDNRYQAAAGGFAEVAGTGMMNFSTWKRRMRQDGRSSLQSPVSH